MIKFEGRHLRINTAPGFRLGCAFINQYKANPDIDPSRARTAMVWVGPYIIQWGFRKKGYEPRLSWDDDRIQSLIEARRNLKWEIEEAFRARHRWNRHVNMARNYGMGQATLDEWQRQSDAVKIQEMENNERTD